MYKPKDGAIAFVEFFPKDPRATQKYFEKVLGWKMTSETVSGVEVWFTDSGSGPEIHMMAPMGSVPPGSAVPFIRVKSIAETTRKVRKNGGKIVVPKYDVPGRGSFAWFEAPGGVVHAVHQSKTRRVYRPPMGRKK